MSEPIRRLELFTEAGRRRTGSDEEKAAIVAESDGPGTSISAVARRHGLSASQLFTLRRLARQAERHDDRTTVRFVPAVLRVGRHEPASAQTGSGCVSDAAATASKSRSQAPRSALLRGASAAQIAAVIRALKSPL